MALPIPSLDDRTYEDLRRSLLAELPLLSTKWTDHNPSDPGIALLELLAAMGEMILYRLDQVPKSVYESFLRMVVDRPEPVTVELLFSRTDTTGAVVVPAGTQVSGSDTQEVFETIREATLAAGEKEVSVPARHREEHGAVEPWTSDGTPGQSFVRQDADDPILLDALRQGSSVYNPNPEVTIDGVTWRFVVDLLEEEPVATVFTVEWLSYRFRFGDGIHGAIPPAGATIVCTRHQVVRGKDAQVAAGSLSEILEPALDLTVTNPDDAIGGRFLFDLESAKQEGLRALWQPERAIAARDFAYMATEAFNELDGLDGPKVRQAKAVRLDDLGTIAVILIPESTEDRWPTPSKKLKDRVYRFLDRRRLITTRLLVENPQYRPVQLTVRIAARGNVDFGKLRDQVVDHLNRYFDPSDGGEEGKGWPLGRNVYRSEICQRLSTLDDVLYIPQVVLNGSAARDAVELLPLELPKVDVKAADVTIVGGAS